MEYEEVSDYVEEWVGEGDRVQKWAYEKSRELSSHGVHPVDPTRGRFLELLARLKSPERVLEVGSGAGYSALWFLKGMGRKGKLETIEVDTDVIRVLRSVLERAGLEGRVKIHHGSAIEVLRKLKGPYDVVFIDADKDEYPDYLDHALRLTTTGATIIADNMLWSGYTIRRDRSREGVDGILEYTKRIFSDPRLVSIIMPLGDGLGVSLRVK